METIGKRLNYLIEDWEKKEQKSHPGSKVKLAALKLGLEVGCSGSAITKIRREESEGTSYAPGLSRFFGCDLTWLETGEGEPFPLKRDGIPIVLWELIPNFSKEKKAEIAEEFVIKKINLKFEDHKRVFGAEIPKTVIPGQTSSFFRPGQTLIISPEKGPNAGNYVVVYNKKLNLPSVYMRYMVDIEGLPFLQEVTEKEAKTYSITEDLYICGVVIADFNLYI